MSGFHAKRSPCQKYFDKTKQDGLQKSLSATRFVPFRRSSDTTSDSGSDDFKLEHAEELSSSFSRGSSSESCHSYGATSRSYHCIIKDLNEINHLERSPAHSELLGGSHSQSSAPNNESLQDFRSRLNCRRKVKTRQVFYPGVDDDRTDNSCDSTTTKAHEDILRSANLLRQEQAAEAVITRLTRTDQQPLQHSSSGAISNLTKDDSFAVGTGGAATTAAATTATSATKKAYLKEVQCTSSTSTSSSMTAASFGKRTFATTSKAADAATRSADESILMSEFDKILQIGDDEERIEEKKKGPSTSIARSSTESFLGKSSAGKANKNATSSPRFRAKTHSQSVLKAATSIPSLIFSNKSLKFQKSSSNIANYSQSAEGSKLVASTTKKNSMDDDFFSISSNSSKTRRSPLRFLGNLVDADKLFRGRWSSAKRAKSTDEITWALANEELGTSNDASARMLKDSGRMRKKSLGIMSTNSTSSNNTEEAQDKKRYKSGSDKAKTMGDMICKKLFDEGYHSNKKDSTASASATVAKSVDLKNRKSSNTSSDLLSISGSSVASLTDHGPTFIGVGPSPSYTSASALHSNAAETKGEVRAETLAEIEAFEELLKNHLQD